MHICLNNDMGINQAYVVFQDNTSLWWLRFLKKGFRHCYLLLVVENGASVLELNPMSNQIFIKFYTQVNGFDYIYQLKKNPQLKVCEAKIGSAPLKCAPVMAFTCVEFVKRVLGIHSKTIITPFQLFNKIKDCRK